MTPCTPQDNELNRLIEMTKSADSDERRSSIYALEQYPREQVFHYLIAALQDENRGVREAAAEVIQQQPAARYAEQLVPLLGSPRIEVRNLVADILTEFGRLATGALIQALTEGNEDERKFAADILGLVGDTTAVEQLGWAAANDPVDNVAISAIEALGKIGSAAALPNLRQLFLTHPTFRSTIAEAIGLIGQPEMASFLKEHLDVNDPIVAFAIVDALGNLGQASSVNVLMLFYEASMGELRHQTAKAILKIARKARMDILNKVPSAFWNSIANLLIEGDQEVEELIVFHMQHSPSATVLVMMSQMLSIAPEHLLLTFINLVKGRPEFFNLLMHLCYHKDQNVAYAAIESLEAFDRNRIIPHLKDIFAKVEGFPLTAALKVVAMHRLTEFLPLIKSLCQNDDLDVQAMAEEVVAYLQSKE